MRYTDEDIVWANGRNIIDVAKELDIRMVVSGTTGRVMASCLWHDGDRHPSMQIGSPLQSPQGGKYLNVCHCYACGETHGVIDLVMKVRNCSFVEAMRWLKPPSDSPQGGRKLTGRRVTGKREKDILKYGVQR